MSTPVNQLDWFVVDSDTCFENGIYEIENYGGCDSELPYNHIEIYDHPIRGQSYWDDGHDDGTDFAGHTPTFQLVGKRARCIQPAPDDGAQGSAEGEGK